MAIPGWDAELLFLQSGSSFPAIQKGQVADDEPMACKTVRMAHLPLRELPIKKRKVGAGPTEGEGEGTTGRFGGTKAGRVGTGDN